METLNAEAHPNQQVASSKVTVYRFKRSGTLQDDELGCEIYATRQAIERFQAELIASSALEVNQSELDSYGRYHPGLPAARRHCAPRPQRAEWIKVYRFRVAADESRRNIPFHCYATEEAIARFRGTIIPGIPLTVRQSDLDTDGVFDPPRLAKNWTASWSGMKKSRARNSS